MPGEPIPGEADPLNESTPSVDWGAIKEQLNDNPLTPTFEPYQTERPLSQAEIKKAGDIKDYLENNPDGSILVVGHTDLSGPCELNMKLSRLRAGFVKDYLVQNGLHTDKVETSFKGPDEPAHDNNTYEGRAKNRRTKS